MNGWLAKAARLDRRWIFLMLAATVAVTQLVGCPPLPSEPSPETKSLFNAIEALPPGAPILISFDFDPASKPELAPAAHAILRHALRKKLRVIMMGLWAPGQGLASSIIRDETDRYYGSAEDAEKHYGKDFVFLGWQPGLQVVIVSMGEDMLRTYAVDIQNRKTKDMPIFRGVERLSDLAFVVSISAGSPGIEEWLVYGQGRHHFPLGTAVTAVSAPPMLAFVRSGQLTGLLGGMKGAAEYEDLLGEVGTATRAMNGLNASHALVAGLVLFANVVFFLERRRTKSSSR